MNLGDTQDGNESKWKVPGSLMRVCRAECGENMTLTEMTRMIEVCTTQGIPTGKLQVLWESKTGVAVPVKTVVFPARIQNKMKS